MVQIPQGMDFNDCYLSIMCAVPCCVVNSVPMLLGPWPKCQFGVLTSEFTLVLYSQVYVNVDQTLTFAL